MLTWFNRRPYLALEVFAWCAFAVAALLPALARDPSTGAAVATTLTLTTLGFVTSAALRRLFIHAETLARGVPFGVIVAVSCYIAGNSWSVLERLARTAIYAWLTDTEVSMPAIRVFFHNGLFFTFILLSWTLLHLGLRRHTEMEEQQKRLLTATTLAREAEVRALRYQLNPHFLFNALNGISTLVLEARPHDAAGMLSQLSNYFRLALAVPSEWASIESEIEFARRYLAIERFRFGDRLKVQFDIAPATLHLRLPALLLQPLLENAVTHGIARHTAGGEVELTTRTDGRALTIELSNPVGAATMIADPDRPSVGLANTLARLDATYGGDASLFTRVVEGRFHVTVSVPVERLGAARAT